ncbi:MAG: hypothetical protein LBQ48_02410, partial [Oscillospiraceae bacterium]|nr:hypothetical protein [Oscillospiraceae bacterium]
MRKPKERTPDKRRVLGGVVAAALTAAIALTGTYAWTAFRESALNETKGLGNPGGRLHDDFNGENKDVYVENYGQQDIYVRIRLDEYMEVGANAGAKGALQPDGTFAVDASNGATAFATGAVIGDMKTWTTHVPDISVVDCDNADLDKFHDYWTWTMGGDKIFMPTFNKNNHSLETDFTGAESWAGIAGTYNDYEHQVGDPEHSGDANPDIPNSFRDTGKDGSHNQYANGEARTSTEYLTDGTNSTATHNAKSTLTAGDAVGGTAVKTGDVITMAAWVLAGKP